jgi:glucosamine-6-phosphate deaminase
MIRLYTYPNPKNAAKAAAEIVAKQLRNKPDSNLGLGAGKVLVPLYEELSRMHMDKLAPLTKFRSFQVCEFLGMPGTHPMSYRFFLVDNFLDHVPVSRRFQKRLPGLPVNMESTCKRFEDRIKRFGGIDLLILNLGDIDFIGFNESGSAFESKTREVILSDEIREVYAPDFPRGSVPRRGITMGIKTILDAKHIVMMVTGSGKAPALGRLFTSRVSPTVPSTALRKHDNVDIIADEAACAEVPSSVKRASSNR